MESCISRSSFVFAHATLRTRAPHRRAGALTGVPEANVGLRVSGEGDEEEGGMDAGSRRETGTVRMSQFSFSGVIWVERGLYLVIQDGS